MKRFVHNHHLTICYHKLLIIQSTCNYHGPLETEIMRVDCTCIEVIVMILSFQVFGKTGLGKQCRSRSDCSDQGDQGAHCLPFCLHVLMHYCMGPADVNA